MYIRSSGNGIGLMWRLSHELLRRPGDRFDQLPTEYQMAHQSSSLTYIGGQLPVCANRKRCMSSPERRLVGNICGGI